MLSSGAIQVLGIVIFLRDNLLGRCDSYTPETFWDGKDIYIEVFVEKVDLKSLFKPVCDEFYIPISNVKGWADIHSRADIMQRFKEHDESGKRIVLLYCGDFDPGGMNISDSLMSNFKDISRAVDWSPVNLEIIRFGLNYHFIINNDLSWVNNLETSSGKRLDDPKHKDHYKPYVQNYIQKYGARKVEANALVTRITQGRQLMRDTINRFIDDGEVLEYETVRKTQVNQLKTLINNQWKVV